MSFNPSSLPAEARKRYEDKVKGKLLTTKIHTPFNTADAHNGLQCWSDSLLDKTIFADGAILFHVSVYEKVVLKTPIPCRKDAHAAMV